MFQRHARSLLEFCIILGQSVGVEKQSLGNKAAVNEGERGLPTAKSAVLTADPATADSKSGPSYLFLDKIRQ